MTAQTKNVLNAWSFFNSHLGIGWFFSAAGWLILMASTLLVCILPRSSELYVQHWWLWGSVCLTMFMSAMVVLLGKALSRSNCAILVPGWRQANLAVVLVWAVLLVLPPFAGGGLWALIAGERWELASLAWLCVAVSVGFIAASIMPSLGSLWQELWSIGIWLGLIATVFSMAAASPKFLLILIWLNAASDHPWPTMVIAAALAAILFARASRHSPQPSKARLLEWVNRLRNINFLMHDMKGRQPLLINPSRLIVAFFNVPVVAFLSVIPASDKPTFTFSYLCGYFFVITSFQNEAGLPRSAAILMWLPAGLKRSNLGIEVFQMVMRRALVLAGAYVVLVSACQWLSDKPISVLVHPETFFLLLACGILLAGWWVAAYRPGNGTFKRMLIAMAPVILLSLVYFGSLTAQVLLAVLFAGAGLLLGLRFSSHWGSQEISALLMPLKTLP
jgi:hypothetical protein